MLSSSLFCPFTQLTPAPSPHVTWCLIWLCYCIVGLFCRRGDDMWQCSSVQATHQQHRGKLSVISAPLTPSGPDCWRWRTRVWTSKLQHQPPPNQHWVETPAQVLRWPDHIWVCGEQSGGWIQAPSGEICAMVWWEPSPPKCNEDEGDRGGFLLSPDVDCRPDVEIIQNYRLEWSTSTEAVYKKALSWLYFHKRFRSLSLCKQMLQMF